MVFLLSEKVGTVGDRGHRNPIISACDVICYHSRCCHHHHNGYGGWYVLKLNATANELANGMTESDSERCDSKECTIRLAMLSQRSLFLDARTQEIILV